MLSFASFVERINEDRVKLRFLTWNGTVIDQFVDRELTKQPKQKRYTDKQWETFHFEDMRFQPCIFTGHSLLDIAVTFVPLEECDVKSMIKNSYPSRDTLYPNDQSVFTNERLSEAWLNQCKRFDPNLQHEIDACGKEYVKTEKDSFTLISGFYWKEVFKPSFIGRLHSRITQIFSVGDRKKTYDKTKFKLIIVPVEKPESTEQTESIPSFAKLEYTIAI